MGFNNRSPSPTSPIASPTLPIADSSQAHDIPTGVAPSLAKLQDWIAWLVANGVLYSDPSTSTIDNDLTITGSLSVQQSMEVTDALQVGADVDVSGGLAVTGDVDVNGNVDVQGRILFSGAHPSSSTDLGANTLRAVNFSKCWAYVETNGSGGVTIHDAINLTSANLTGGVLRLTFTRAFANANYSAVVTVGNAANFATIASKNALYVDLQVFDANSPGSNVDLSANVRRINVDVHGRQ
jgi:hypothetical protein